MQYIGRDILYACTHADTGNGTQTHTLAFPKELFLRPRGAGRGQGTQLHNLFSPGYPRGGRQRRGSLPELIISNAFQPFRSSSQSTSSRRLPVKRKQYYILQPCCPEITVSGLRFTAMCWTACGFRTHFFIFLVVVWSFPHPQAQTAEEFQIWSLPGELSKSGTRKGQMTCAPLPQRDSSSSPVFRDTLPFSGPSILTHPV